MTVRTRHPAAFTLVELIVAITLTVLVTGATVGILRSTSAACRHADSQLDLQQQARSAILAVSAALRNVDRFPDRDAPFEGLDEWLDDDHQIPADSVRFLAVSRKTVRHAQPESDVKEFEFRLKPATGQALPMLMCRTDPTRNEDPDGGGVIELVAENVMAFNLAYYDGTSWQPDWPASMQKLPVAVRVRITVVDQDDPTRFWTARRLIYLPYRRTSGESESS